MEVTGSLICKAKFTRAAHGQPTPLPTELPNISIYGSSGQPNFHGKIPMGSPLRCPLSCPLFSYLEAVGCLLSCPLFPYMEVVGSLICMAKFPWAAHSVPISSEVGSSPVFPYGFSLFRHFWGITLQLFKLLCLVKDHWGRFSTRKTQMVHIVN